ncbi:MAG: sulfite exporter TauE/SafE family protein [Candidatus Solibacter usitatus]|nr:sulfite exporter TauE/SafE family protein [Candidatus Solibacter usitatus]
MEALLGFGIALVVGLTGMGGGPLAAPLLMLVLGVPAVEAVGTSLLFVTITKSAAALVYWSRGHVDWPTLRRLCLGGLPGILLGTLLLQRMSQHPRLQPIVLTMIGAIIALLALLSLWRSFRKAAASERRERPGALPWLAFPIGLEVGFSSAGAGALTSLSLLECTRLEPARIVGTDLVFGLAIAALGGGIHLASGNLNQHLLLALSSGGVFGALCGAWLGTRVPSRVLRVALSAVMIILGQQLLWRGVAALSR